jgi:cytochrome P450
MSVEEAAYYLQGTYFNTAVVQMSEAMAHVLMVLARHPSMQARVDDDVYLDNVISETFRMFPLFGIAHRITSDEIVVDSTTIPRGSVLCFNYPDYHRAGYDHADTFAPSRWDELVARHANFIPFGVVANRACPARGVAPITMRVVVREVVRRYALHTAASHTRSIPNRGPCLLAPRGVAVSPLWLRIRLVVQRLADRWGDVWRSLVQLVLGTCCGCVRRTSRGSAVSRR